MYLNDRGTRILYRNTNLFKFEDPFEYCCFSFHRKRANFFRDRSRIIILTLLCQVLLRKLTNIFYFYFVTF